jgi:hydrogenase maturation protease
MCSLHILFERFAYSCFTYYNDGVVRGGSLKSLFNSKTLVLGIGNTILRDDGIGPIIIDQARKRLSDSRIHFQTTNSSGVHLMDLISGYERIVIVDAVRRGERPGKIEWLKPGDFASGNSDFNSQHRVGILQAIKLTEDTGQPAPKEIDIMAVEVADCTNFGKDMTPEVEQSIPEAVEELLNHLNKIGSHVT